MKIVSKQAAIAFINEKFPNCDVALLAGSAARDELTSHSDLDVVILDQTQSSNFRQCFVWHDWKMETFVYNHPTSLSFAFDASRLEAIPTIPRMCAERIVLKDNGLASQIKSQAMDALYKGPVKWTKDNKESMQYMISDLLDDLRSNINVEEKIFVAYKLFDYVAEFTLRANGHWIGYGKWLYRSLLNFDEQFAKQHLDVFQDFMKTGKSEPLCTFIDNVLEQHGGELFEGYIDRL
ncbi:nucleotidyltransferase domain-containing protein [Salipaludibacillus daqingensis]|uniref:nucleotidyltransferase domain-containing protein n=1 Tax=Salipaludibacillus daqingensis TaxID=3041001 RepID=UPI0024772D75|nr:nucleotidyltransferase domain-containing protein [Salipaludibacillus daqingensis]